MAAAYKPKTLRQAKAEYKAHSSLVSPVEQKRLERGHELDRRAQAVRQQDARKRDAERKRKLQEEREKEERTKMGIGLATQLVGYSVTQKKMKSGLEPSSGIERAIRTRTSELRRRETEVYSCQQRNQFLTNLLV